MNTSITGALLAHEKVDRYRSFGAFGKPAYQSHVQLRAMLKSKRGDKFANYFAKPTLDPEAGELRWTAEVRGEARGWNQLSPEEQGERALDLEVMRSGLMSFAQELRAQGGGAQPGGAAAFASLLEQAMKVPAQGNFLYFVGDQPVIAFWGFEDHGGTSVDPAAAAPQLAAAAPADAVPVAPVAVPDTPRRKWPWWWWLFWLLLALLLLALLLLLPRACTPGGGFDLKRAIPGLGAPDDAASAPRVEPGASAALPGGGAVPGINMPPGTEGPGVALPGGPAPGGTALPDTAPGTEPVLPGASQPGLGTLPPGLPDNPLGQLNPQTDPPRLPDAKDDAVAKPDKGMTNPPLSPNDAPAMKLPEEATAQKKLDFLEGGWKAGEGLFDKRSGQPLDLSFNFGKDGKGELALRRPDGTVCRGTVQGRMNGGKLGIEGSQSIPCSNGTSYGAPKIECQKERDGKTQCYGINSDGSRYYMDMHRK